MKPTEEPINTDSLPSIIEDNVIQPFSLETSNLRGRLVRLGGVIDDIITSHNAPDIVNQILGETMTLCSLLSSMLKYEGIFTLQTQGDGPVSMLISDMTSEGGLRACANYDSERLEQVIKQLSAFSKEIDEGSNNHLAQLLGKGYIAFTVDQGQHTDRYQGIVDLKGASLVDCAQHYFSQSEQIGTGIIMAVGLREGRWRAGGVMLQHMPEDEKNLQSGVGNLDEDEWRRAMILMQSCQDEELLSPELKPHDLLLRLFHEEGVRVYEPIPVSKACRCSDDKVQSILMMMSQEERQEMTVDGHITMRCEFCSKDFIFDPKHIKLKTDEVGPVSS